jgi:hypothetical protein
MAGFEGMEHLAIEFKDGAQSSVQEEIRNWRKLYREQMHKHLAIKDGPSARVQQAKGYRVGQSDNPVIKEET